VLEGLWSVGMTCRAPLGPMRVRLDDTWGHDWVLGGFLGGGSAR
jgi:hypothetical protein